MTEVTMVVRRYGRVGGMESYVFNLTGALLNAGVAVNVIAEEVVDLAWGGEVFYVVKTPVRRSRWRQMYHFRETADLTMNREGLKDKSVIHSHERTLYNDVTTAHGPLFETSGYLTKLLSPRVRFWETAESQEFLGSNNSIIVAVSELARSELLAKYSGLLPESRVLIGHPGVPASKTPTHQEYHCQNRDTVRVVMVGREWARKGFDFGLSICASLQRRSGFKVIVDLIGCAKFKHEDFPDVSVNFKGWVDSWWMGAKYDLMLHPAKVEPFGMAVCEAANAGVPVLCSDRVGALDFRCGQIFSLSLSSSIDEWSRAGLDIVKKKLTGKLIFSEIRWTWEDLAALHLDRIYPFALEKKYG